jgi:hypothetical protein
VEVVLVGVLAVTGGPGSSDVRRGRTGERVNPSVMRVSPSVFAGRPGHHLGGDVRAAVLEGDCGWEGGVRCEKDNGSCKERRELEDQQHELSF